MVILFVYKVLSYASNVMFVARCVFVQKIADKRFGATYLTILASFMNFSMIIVDSISLKLVSFFGFAAVFYVISAFNFYTIVFVREGYLKWLGDKKPEEFEIKGVSVKPKEE